MPLLHDLVDALHQGKVFDPSLRTPIRRKEPAVSRWLLGVASEAVCFDAGDATEFPQLKIVPELFRMPYRATWFEGRLRDGIVAVLVAETGENRTNQAVFNKRAGCHWQLNAVVETYFETDDDGETDLRIGMVADVAIPRVSQSVFEYCGLVISRLVVPFVMALGCRNTVPEMHPAPEQLNKSRVRRGKAPIVSYWTLHLKSPSSSSEAKLGGTHASPRVHLRRGHIRQYAPGKFTWVDACVVGNKANGMVIKDYALSADAVSAEAVETTS